LGALHGEHLGIAGATALLLLKEVSRLQPGEMVLVPGAGGGVEGYAVQLAKLLGAGTVIGAASTPEKQALAWELGADHVIDYTQPEWPEQVRELTGARGEAGLSAHRRQRRGGGYLRAPRWAAPGP
jgi:NADPH:quinone reductase